MGRTQITIGLFGFGVVGFGLWEVLEKTPGLKANIRRICVKTHGKKRPIPDEHFTFDKNDILNDEAINVVVELIDDADAAFEIVSTAMRNGKGVVSANKKMIAEHLPELLALQKEYAVPFLYEAATCASIPIIRNLEEYYDNDLLVSLQGIVNGSTNYILTRTAVDGISYNEALALAQQKGYAESNPALDVEGYDAKYKLTILLAHAVKLAGDKAAAFVLPQFVDSSNRFYTVDDVFNGVQTETSFADKQFFVGKGAGAFPTASAVLSDISALSYDYRYEYKKMAQQSLSLTSDFNLEVFVRHKDDNLVPLEDFIEISEHYRSVAGHYIVGWISFETLVNSAWISSPGVSVLMTSRSEVRTETRI
jgi:homoserine dehydrogenase